jgi:hypothetical protein
VFKKAHCGIYGYGISIFSRAKVNEPGIFSNFFKIKLSTFDCGQCIIKDIKVLLLK